MRNLTYRLVAGGLGLILGLVIAEITLRVLRLVPADGVATVTAAQFDALPGIFAPRQELVDLRNRNLPHQVAIDSLGYRGQPFPRRKPPGELRVLMLGDSHVYGDFVDNGETLPSQLERELRVHCNNVRVINAGLGGSTITDQARLLERALPLAPDIVILVFGENDVRDLGRSSPLWNELAENRRLKSETVFSFVYPTLRRTALWNLALKVKARLSSRKAAARRSDQREVSSGEPATRLRGRYEEELIALSETLHQRDIPFLLVAYPSHLTVYGTNTRAQLDWVMQVTKESAIDGINLLDPLRSTGLPDSMLFLLPHDGHPSPRGYAIAAQQVAAHLRQSGILPADCRDR